MPLIITIFDATLPLSPSLHLSLLTDLGCTRPHISQSSTLIDCGLATLSLPLFLRPFSISLLDDDMAPANGVKQEKTNDAIPPPRSRPSPIKREEKKKETPPPPPPTTYRDIPLFSTDSGPWITHLMKFAHHTRVDPSDVSQFIPPVKLNRKNPPRPKIPQPKPGDPVTDRYGKHMMGKDGKPLNWPAPGEDLSRIEEVIKPSGAASQPKAPGADQSLIAPGSNPATSGRPPKSRLFQKRVKEIHKAADHARKTMKEEHFPWVLEDFETSQEWESVRNPIPTGQKALEGWVEELKKKQALKLEEQGEQGQDGEDIKMESAVKPEPNPEEGSKDRGAPGSISHAPWIGKLEGDSDENSSSHHVLFVFDERGAGGFKVVPVTRMYKFLQKPKHSTLTYEQVEAEFQKFQKNKEVDRWMMRTKRGEGGPSSFAAVKADRDAWNGWGNVGGISLPSGSGSRGFGVPGGSSASSSRRRNLMAVHGGELLRDDDDDGIGSRRRRDDDTGHYDELDYEEDFADDEEKMDGGDPFDEDSEVKELDERLKREMARANRVGDDDEAGIDGEGSAGEDERGDEQLTGSGRQMMKIMRALARREGNEAYERDDEGRNPYASEDSDEDEEETYVAHPEEAIRIAREERERLEKEAARNNAAQEKRKGTPGTGTASGSMTPTGRAEKQAQNKAPPQPVSGGGARIDRPGAGHANVAQRATSPTRSVSKQTSRPGSRSTSPKPADAPSRASPGPRATSPMATESPLSANMSGVGEGGTNTAAGVKRKTDSGTSVGTPSSTSSSSSAAINGGPGKDAKRIKRMGGGGGGASGSRAGSPGSASGSRPSSRAGSPAAAAPLAPGSKQPANAVEAEVIQLVRDGKISSTSDLVQHFKKRLKSEPQIKELLSAAVKRVAVMDKVTNKLKLREGF